MEKVTDPPRILALLQRLRDHRSLIAIRLQDHDTTYISAIIEVNAQDGYLVLDELKPESGHQRLKGSPTIKARGQVDGVVISFISPVTEFGEQEGVPFYKLPIPPIIGYQQRRQNVRIRVGAAHSLSAKISMGDESSSEGLIEDLSLGGLRIRFKKDLPDNFQEDSHIICNFTINDSNKEALSCEAIIRSIKHAASSYGKPFVGAQFVEMDRNIERQLQKLIMNLQRAQQKKRGI